MHSNTMLFSQQGGAVIPSFSLKTLPQIHFGAGRLTELPKLVSRYGNRLLIILGGESFQKGGHWSGLQASLQTKAEFLAVEHIRGEPSPEAVDEIAGRYKPMAIDVVLAIGGGSVIDAGKAVSAMLVEEGPVERYLEGGGDKVPSGYKVPFIAVPTTAGTGSEATSNAVLTRTGSQGFKRSLRHDNYVPDIALVDPALTLGCPRDLTIACGMDTFSQLVEAYLSSHASPFTDALAFDGIKRVQRSLRSVCMGAGNLRSRSDMAYAALVSGIVLANAGLGVIHGFASAIGGIFAIPHGLICGTLMASGNRVTLNRLRRTDEAPLALEKYSRLGQLFSQKDITPANSCQELFITELERLTDDLALPLLSHFGVNETHLDTILDRSGNKYNPAALERKEMRAILTARL